MKSKNYGWQKFWLVSVDDRSCSHDSGLVVEWTDHNVLVAPAATVREHGVWSARIRGGRDAVEAWLGGSLDIPETEALLWQNAMKQLVRDDVVRRTLARYGLPQ